jgi:hypothetical protein
VQIFQAELARRKWIWNEPDEGAQLFRQVHGWCAPTTVPRLPSETPFPPLVAGAFGHLFIDPDYFVRWQRFHDGHRKQLQAAAAVKAPTPSLISFS